MIELFFTAAIIWTTQANVAHQCDGNAAKVMATDIGGCYNHDNKTIYMTTGKIPNIGVGKDYILYHEVGHSLYWMDFPKDIFKTTPGFESFSGPDYEVIADDFAWWMYAKKHPKELKFVNSILTQAKRDYFAGTCKKKCVDAILKLKIK